MPDLDSTNALLAALLAGATLIGIVVGWARWIRPRLELRMRTREGIRETILGRPPVYDKANPGKILAAAQPGLATRLDTLEGLVAQIADQQRKLDSHDHRITELENARVERVATQLEATAMWEGIGRLHDGPDRIDPPDTDNPATKEH